MVIAVARDGSATTGGTAGFVCVTSMISGARNVCPGSAMRAALVLLSLPIVRTSSETPPASQSPLLYTCLFSGRLPDMVLSGTFRRLLHRQCVVQVWRLRGGILMWLSLPGLWDLVLTLGAADTPQPGDTRGCCRGVRAVGFSRDRIHARFPPERREAARLLAAL